MFCACLIAGLNYIGGSERKFQSDNGSAALLRRRTAFLLRGIRVEAAWGAGGTEQLMAGGNYLARGSSAERSSWRREGNSSGRIAGGTELLLAGGNFSERIAGGTEQLTAGGKFLAEGLLAERNS